MTLSWKPIPGFDHLEWAESSVENHVVVRVKSDPLSETIVEGRAEFAQWVADNSASPEFMPIGDWIHKVAETLGMKRCEPCAKRQALLNALIRRRQS